MTDRTPKSDSRIYVAGHTGLVGSAIMRSLTAGEFTEIITRDISELDLRDQETVRRFFQEEKPEFVILAAARVGGIKANNTYPAEFIYDNLSIELNVIDSAYRLGVKRLIFLGSSCIYPKHAPQPMKEEHLLSGYLEPTNEPYAVAKIAGIKLCQSYNRQYGTDYISLMPTNLYGPGDNFDLETSHVLPAMIRKFHDAKVNDVKCVILWGTGTPSRELLYVDDLADAIRFILTCPCPGYDLINVGYGTDYTIADIAGMVCSAVGYRGDIDWDSTVPDGTPRKLIDSSILRGMGWEPKVEFADGIRMTYEWLLQHQASG